MTLIAQKIYVGNIGTIIDIDMGEDVSQATELSWNIRRPDGGETTWTPQVYDTTFLRYVLQVGDVSLAGVYHIQPKLTLGSWVGFGSAVELRVYALFE